MRFRSYSSWRGLFKSLGTLDILSADQLSGFVKMFSHNNPVRYVRLETKLATLRNVQSQYSCSIC